MRCCSAGSAILHAHGPDGGEQAGKNGAGHAVSVVVCCRDMCMTVKWLQAAQQEGSKMPAQAQSGPAILQWSWCFVAPAGG